MVSQVSGAVAGMAGAHKDSPQKIKDTVSQFEALLVGEMLKSMRGPDGSGWLGTGEDQAGGIAIEMAQECLATAISSSGGLGIAPVVESALGKAGQTAQR